MSTKGKHLRFIKSVWDTKDQAPLLTATYANDLLSKGKVVQVIADNCVLQAMEKLPQIKDQEAIRKLGLVPLVDLLNSSTIAFSPFGFFEMPGMHKETAIAAYNLFCDLYWSRHENDGLQFAPIRTKQSQSYIGFSDLDDAQKMVLSPNYYAFLMIQLIQRVYCDVSAIEKIQIYLSAVVNTLNIISEFHLEIAKFAFWDADFAKDNSLHQEIILLRKDLKENFFKSPQKSNKSLQIAFNAAMDYFWIFSGGSAPLVDMKISINNVDHGIEVWIATLDEKLARIHDYMHPVLALKDQHALAIYRKPDMKKFGYWENVDSISNGIRFNKEIDPNMFNREYFNRVYDNIERTEKMILET
jgi:hypothetical protein